MILLHDALILFWEFFRIGAFTFGGGWSIVAQMQKLYVEKKKVITAEELLDLTSVGRSLPGTMIGNVAMLYGYRADGVLGGLACCFGLVLPPMLILILVTAFYTAFRDNAWVAAAMEGVRCAVVPIIASATAGLVKGAFKIPACWIVAAAALALYLIWNVSCVWLVVFGAIAGLVICEIYERRGKDLTAPDSGKDGEGKA